MLCVTQPFFCSISLRWRRAVLLYHSCGTDSFRWLRHDCCGLVSAVGGRVWLVWGLCDAGQVIQLSPWVQGVTWGVYGVSSCQISSRVSRLSSRSLNRSNRASRGRLSVTSEGPWHFPALQALSHTPWCVWSCIRKPYCCTVSLTSHWVCA